LIGLVSKTAQLGRQFFKTIFVIIHKRRHFLEFSSKYTYCERLRQSVTESQSRRNSQRANNNVLTWRVKHQVTVSVI